MADLLVFHDGFDWVIAESAEVAAELVAEMRGNDPPVGADEFSALPMTTKVGVLCNKDGKPDDNGKGVKKTCAEWIAQCGKGILCSRDF